MIKVEKLSPHDVPGRCLLFPQIISDEEGFYLGMELDGMTPGNIRTSISVKGIKEVAAREGMLYPAQAAALQQRIEELEVRLDQEQRARVEAEEYIDSIDGLVKSHDMVIRKKMGRPTTKVKEAA